MAYTAPCDWGRDPMHPCYSCIRRGYFKDPKRYHWAFGIVTLEREGNKQLSILPDVSKTLPAVGLMRAKEELSVSTITVVAISHQPRLPNSYPQTDSSTGEPRPSTGPSGKGKSLMENRN